jgi:signal peptidase
MQGRHPVFPHNNPFVHNSKQLIHMIPTQKSTNRLVLTAVTAVTLLLFGHFLAPVQLGGKVGYAIVIGGSMQPNISKGDIAIVHAAPAYEPGDAIIYAHPQTGWIIHRVIGQTDNGYQTRGDNNYWVDHYQPNHEEIVGKLWRYLPASPATTELLEMSRQIVSSALAAGQ